MKIGLGKSKIKPLRTEDGNSFTGKRSADGKSFGSFARSFNGKSFRSGFFRISAGLLAGIIILIAVLGEYPLTNMKAVDAAQVTFNMNGFTSGNSMWLQTLYTGDELQSIVLSPAEGSGITSFNIELASGSESQYEISNTTSTSSVTITPKISTDTAGTTSLTFRIYVTSSTGATSTFAFIPCWTVKDPEENTITINGAGDTQYQNTVTISCSLKYGTVDKLYLQNSSGETVEDSVTTGTISTASLTPGVYTVVASSLDGSDIDTDGNTIKYAKADAQKSFTVTKRSTSLSVNVSGTTITPTLTCTFEGGNKETFDSSQYTMYYKKSSESDSAYTTTAPSTPGDYTAKAVITGDDYKDNFADATADFSIQRKEGGGTVRVDDVVYGTKIVPVVNSDKNGIDHVTFYYKLATQTDGYYTKDNPVKPGNYVVKAVFAETDEYGEYAATDAFTIKKANGAGQVTAADCYAGYSPELKITNTKNTSKEYVIQYKSADGTGTYTTAVPTEPGSYVVRVTFPEDEIYLSAYAEDTFTVMPLPVPTYTISGTKGKNGYYISDVTITPEDGFEISAAGTSSFSGSVVLHESVGSLTLNFRMKSNGVVTKPQTMAAVRIDKDDPEVAGILNQSSYFSETRTVTIKDENLTSVTVNGENVAIRNGQAQIELEANYGIQEYEIVVTDLAGHTSTYKTIIKSPWLETGIVIPDIPLDLEAGSRYEFDEGEWTVEGDDTVYAGGMEFYVPEDAVCTFHK